MTTAAALASDRKARPEQTPRAEPGYFGKLLYVMRDQRGRLAGMIGIFIMLSVLELVGVSLIGPYIGAVINPSVLGRFPRFQQTMAALGANSAREQIVALGWVLIVVFLIKGLAAYGAQRHVYRFSFQFRTRLLKKLMTSYVYMPYRFFLERNSSTIIRSILDSTKVMADDLLIPSLRLCSDLCILIFMGVLLSWMSPQAMLMLGGLLAAATVVYLRIVRPRVRLAGEVAAVANDRIIRGVNQAIGGIKEIRTLRTEEHFLGAVTAASDACASAQSGFQALLSLPKFMMETALVFFVILFSMYVTSKGDSGGGLVTVLAMFGVAGIRILPALSQVSSSIASMSYSAYSLDEIYRDLSEAEAIGIEKRSAAATPGAAIGGFHSAELHGIRFAYPGSTGPTIDNVSLRIIKGESIGLIGPSGSGKTTLVDILLGLHHFDSGRFLIDGEDIESYGWERWRDRIAYIPQNAFLIDDTLAHNIAFGVPDDQVDLDRVAEAVTAAQLSTLVERLPEGLDTVVGERGIRLSGGERQRIALARAFYSGRDVLILDEATSALDQDTERQVVEVIGDLHGKITLIVIAHRLSTVAGCDLIHRLEQGRIVTSGSYREVVEEGGTASPSSGRGLAVSS